MSHATPLQKLWLHCVRHSTCNDGNFTRYKTKHLPLNSSWWSTPRVYTWISIPFMLVYWTTYTGMNHKPVPKLSSTYTYMTVCIHMQSVQPCTLHWCPHMLRGELECIRPQDDVYYTWLKTSADCITTCTFACTSSCDHTISLRSKRTLGCS